MNGNELMIGDWVRPIGCNPFRIGCVLGEMVCNESDTQSWCDDEIEPIPLTPEILEKNGWKREVCKGVDYMTRNELSKERNGEDIWLLWDVKCRVIDAQKQSKEILSHGLCVSHVIAPCNFVHELQHALRVCGIEKDIEL